LNLLSFLCALAPLRETNSSDNNRQRKRRQLTGRAKYSSFPILAPFRHPSLTLPGLHPSVHRIPEYFNAIGRGGIGCVLIFQSVVVTGQSLGDELARHRGFGNASPKPAPHI